MSETKSKVTYDGKDYEIIKEGLAEILQPAKDPAEEPKSKADVFYNPIQQFNRDLSVLAIRVFSQDYNLWRSKKPGRRDEEAVAQKRKRVPNGSQENVESKRPRVADVGAQSGDAQKLEAPQEAASAAKDGSEAAVSEPAAPAGAPTGPKRDEKPSFRVLDALSATGLRALRYSKEIEDVTMVTANDLSASAIDSIKLHITHNNLAGQIFPLKGNAMAHMYHVGSEGSPLLPDGSRGKYQVVDLDPYGTAVPFLDAAVQSVSEGGMLAITCTDSGVFASQGYSEKTFSQYGGLPAVGPHSQEGGLRLLLHAVATSAARYGMAIEPVLSLSIDYYIRAFVRVRRSPGEVKFLAGKTMQVYNCDSGCGAWTVQPLGRTTPQANRKGETFYKYTPGLAPTAAPTCEHCGFRTHLAGPMWGGPIQNPAFIQRMLDLLPALDREVYGTVPRLEGMLLTARDETLLPDDALPAEGASAAGALIPRLPPQMPDPHPFFFQSQVLAKVLHCESIPHALMRSALLGLGYRATRSHTKPGSIRTDAPWAVVWEVMREWIRQRAPTRDGALKPGTPGAAIMRADRSRRGLAGARAELAAIAAAGEDVAQVKERMQAMLWRLEHPAEGAEGAEGADAASQSRAEQISQLKVVFSEALGKEPAAKKVIRYQANPAPNWGPQARAKG